MRLMMPMKEIVTTTFQKNYGLDEQGAERMYRGWLKGFAIELTGGR